ncbi:type 3 dihydrofolate reductase [Shewanella sp. GXUN23E]|uniref:type 3 dihydrofolate reductase n=1 Tax=Shewanella sp. GXUN23E TaxID=3422498 RepID=UPI003D7ECF1C
MKIAMIAAMAHDRVIGLDNQMPWHLPEDLRHFKAVTMGKPVVMGRRTYESIGRPLPGRLNIVISRNPELKIEGVSCVTSFDEALVLCGECEELMVIGGGQLYAQLLPEADILYLTEIDLQVQGDTRFPEWQADQWQESELGKGISEQGLGYRFIKLIKKC